MHSTLALGSFARLLAFMYTYHLALSSYACIFDINNALARSHGEEQEQALKSLSTTSIRQKSTIAYVAN